jgi:hypothetical protein
MGTKYTIVCLSDGESAVFDSSDGKFYVYVNGQWVEDKNAHMVAKLAS